MVIYSSETDHICPDPCDGFVSQLWRSSIYMLGKELYWNLYARSWATVGTGFCEKRFWLCLSPHFECVTLVPIGACSFKSFANSFNIKLANVDEPHHSPSLVLLVPSTLIWQMRMLCRISIAFGYWGLRMTQSIKS